MFTNSTKISSCYKAQNYWRNPYETTWNVGEMVEPFFKRMREYQLVQGHRLKNVVFKKLLFQSKMVKNSLFICIIFSYKIFKVKHEQNFKICIVLIGVHCTYFFLSPWTKRVLDASNKLSFLESVVFNYSGLSLRG